MKKMRALFLAAALLMLLLPGLAGAENVVEVDEFLMCAAGEVRLPYYPDFSSRIGEGLLQEDFVITYSSSSPYVTVAEDGCLAISESVGMSTNLPLEITYTPKVEGVGETTVFKCRLRTTTPIKELTPDTEELRIRVGEYRDIIYDLNGGSLSLVAEISADQSVVTVEELNWEPYLKLRVTGAAPGDTDVVVTAYSGLQAVVPVMVVSPPTKAEFAADRFACYFRETVEIGLDTGNGAEGLELYPPRMKVYREGQSGELNGFFPEDPSVFFGKETGSFIVQVTAEGGYQATTYVDVYHHAWCDSIVLSTGELYLDREAAEITIYDEYGDEVWLPMTITQGADIVTFTGNTIKANAAGTVEITVTNDDGSTTSQVFEVKANPTEMTLNASELTLEIGQTFDLEVSFDQGSYAHEYSFTGNDANAYGLTPIRMDGDRIVAQAPGEVTLTVTAGPFTASCTVTVPDSDAAVRFVTPEGDFEVGDTFQLSVVDGTGAVLPASFYARGSHGDQAATVTPEGLMTGVFAGSNRICAQLDDGRLLYCEQVVVQYPTTLMHPDMTVHENAEVVDLESIQTDAGVIYGGDVTVAVADESVATYDFPFFTLHKPGTTEVTLTALKGGAQTTFTLTVLPADDTLYIDGENEVHSMSLPSGYYTTLPTVTDYYGNAVSVAWEMTYHRAGSGNPEDEGFILVDDVLICTWPSAYCELTATSESGETIRLCVTGYRLAEELAFRFENYTVKVGESVQVSVSYVEAGDGLGPVYWMVEDGTIAAFSQTFPQTPEGMITGLKPGVTTLTAVLVNGAQTSCTITVQAGRVPGDANEDGAVDIHDALLVLQRDAGWNVSLNRDNADVDGSGAVDIYDALRILRYGAGEDVTLQ